MTSPELHMPLVTVITQGISIVLFLGYGTTCLLSKTMAAEFVRYQLPQLRVQTGMLQIAGSLGMIAGHLYRPLLLLSAGGLAIMMFIAVITRFRIRDPLYMALPAFCLCVLNLFIFVKALRS